MPLKLTEAEIVERAQLLPAFPSVVTDVLATLDDEGATVNTLTALVARDPVVTARILSLANAAAKGGQWRKGLRDMHVAISLIGLSRVREIVLNLSLADFAEKTHVARGFWQHSVAIGIASQELARLKHGMDSALVSTDYALVAGLLHDIGQLWMARFYPLEYQMVKMAMARGKGNIIDLERQYFGIDHSCIGAILASGWGLPSSIVEAIGGHHQIDPGGKRLVAIVHVAEVLVTALELSAHDVPRIEALSEDACELVGLDWSEDLSSLFGRIEARARHATAIFS